MGTGLVNNKDQVVSLPPTVPPLMACVKMEDVGAEKARGSRFDLNSATRKLYEQLQIALKSVGIKYYVPVQKLVEAVEQSGDDITGGGPGVICNQPFNTCRIPELGKSKA